MRDVSIATADGLLKEDYNPRRKVAEKPKRVGPEMRFRTVSRNPGKIEDWAKRGEYSEDGVTKDRPTPSEPKKKPVSRRVGPEMRLPPRSSR